MLDFHGTSVFITGAGRPGGIGHACAELLAGLGASVALADLEQSAVHDIAASLPGPGAHTSHVIDVSNEQSVNACIDDALATHGTIGAAILNAAILVNKPVLETSADDWERVFSVNCTGVFLTARAIASAMKTRSGGSIVAVASNAAFIPRLNNAAYCASKAAVVQFVRCMALELAPFGVRMNALCPGSTNTSMALDKVGGEPNKMDALINGSLSEWRTGIPLGKLAGTADQAATAAFLLSGMSGHITGQSLNVDGGQVML